MRALRRQLIVNLKLHFRNRMALLYSYLFPSMFLAAFWALYRYEDTPLVRHIGELLTIAALGGACFGLPTTMVSERERGVWRRYRLAPVSTGVVVTGTLAARYVLLVVAGLLQVVLAMGLGMPLPSRPVEMVVAFTVVAFAFMGIGLVIAMLADNVPAVQALGQCIFLPMLIIGGVAVPLASLPDWAVRVSGYLPGRYAVDAIQATANGGGLATTGFALVALAFIGAAAVLAGAKLFRWDQEQRFAATRGKGWVAVALAAWIAVGVSADVRRSRTPPRAAGAIPQEPAGRAARAPTVIELAPPKPPPAEPTDPPPPASDTENAAPRKAAPSPAPDAPAHAAPDAEAPTAPAAPPQQPVERTEQLPPPAPTFVPSEPAPGEPLVPDAPQTWQAVTVADIERDLVFDRLPPDGGVVTPIAEAGMYPEQEVANELAALADILVAWLPGHATDPVQRTRNLLFVAAVVDVAQMPMEPYLPEIVYNEIRQRTSSTDLLKVLYWIAVHPDGGTVPTVEEFRSLGLRQVSPDTGELRNRAAIYGVKLLGRMIGRVR
jgi:ABC-type transport system involved in cytochrome c biogenesis permease component